MKAQHGRYTVRKGQLTLVQKEHTMLKRIITLVILCAAITSCGSQNSPVASHITPGTPVAQPASKTTPQISSSIANQLNLTDLQRRELAALQTQYQEDLKAFENDPTATAEDAAEEFESSFYAILNAEQQAVYQAIKAESQSVVTNLRDRDI